MRKDPLYFIAILPPAEIQEEITAFKNNIAESWGPRHALRSPPHITLQPPFAWPDQRLSELQACLRDFAAKQTRFYVQLKNFGAFPPGVVFVQPVLSKELAGIYTNLIQCLQTELGFTDTRNQRSFHPHMTIAHRDVDAAVFPDIWRQFKGMPYERVFRAELISLLKLHEGKWKPGIAFPLR